MLTLLSKRQSDAVRRVTTAEGQIKHLLVRFVQGAPRTITASPRSAKSSVLNARETEIINHISHGLSKEIARALRLAPDRSSGI
jgi:DNA-binding NarL/FixJ family response regulator